MSFFFGRPGGLAEEVDERVLHAAFIPFGDITDIQIPLDYETGEWILNSALVLAEFFALAGDGGGLEKWSRVRRGWSCSLLSGAHEMGVWGGERRTFVSRPRGKRVQATKEETPKFHGILYFPNSPGEGVENRRYIRPGSRVKNIGNFLVS